MADPYDHKREILTKEREEHEAKVQEKAFSQMARKKDTFNPIKEVFGTDVPLPKEEEKIPSKEHISPHMPLHDKAFKPSNPPKHGYNKTLEKFPAYKEDPLKFITRKKPVEGEEERPSFRPSHKGKTIPMNPIATNYRNLKTEFPSIFRRL